MTRARNLFLLDSITRVDPRCAGQVVVSGSHGGATAAGFVLDQAAAPHAVFFNDAGVGKDDAGIAALAMLEAREVICAVYSHLSARIGDSADGRDHGVISHLNAAARAAGLAAGMPVREALARLGVAAGSGAGTATDAQAHPR